MLQMVIKTQSEKQVSKKRKIIPFFQIITFFCSQLPYNESNSMHPQLLERFKCKFASGNNRKSKNWGTFFNSQHFEGKKGMLEFRNGDYNKWQASQLFIWTCIN